MRVVFDHQIFSLQVYGGISRYFFELSRNIKSKTNKNTIQIIAPLYINKYLNRKDISIKGLKIPGENEIGKFIYFANMFISPLMISSFKPDILHHTYYFNQTGFLNNKYKKVITIHDMIHEIYPHYFKNSKYYIEAKKNAVKKADHIICISENTQRDLIKILGVKYEKTSVIYHGFLSQESYFIDNKELVKPFILFVGSRNSYKNFRSLLSVFASKPDLYKNYNLVAFGGGPFCKKEITLINELGLSKENVIYKKGDDHTLKGLYKRASLFVYPSLYEGFGLPPLEAMSCGCPVACSNSSSMPEVAGNAATYFDPKSLDSIYIAIAKTLNDKQKIEQLKIKGFKRIKKFEWAKCAKMTSDIYGNLIK